MHALVTGAAGFLGKYVAEQLVEQGHQVRGFARGDYPCMTSLGVNMVMVIGDVRDKHAVARACEGIDVVFHTAAVAGIWGPWDHFYGINTVGTENVIAGCRAHGVARLVFTSSPSVTFSGQDQVNVDESEPYPEEWLCAYPQTKALAEQAVLDANEPNRLMTCALRPHLIWGPRDQHLIPRLLDRAKKGKLRRVGSGQNFVDMIYVENAAHAHLQAADALHPNSPVCGRAYFISQGEPVNCWEWIDAILALAELPPVRRSISRTAAERVGAVLEALHRLLRIRSEPRMTRFLAAQLSTSHYFNLTRAREDFGYNPLISTEEGMRRLGTWLQGGKVAR